MTIGIKLAVMVKFALQQIRRHANIKTAKRRGRKDINRWFHHGDIMARWTLGRRRPRGKPEGDVRRVLFLTVTLATLVRFPRTFPVVTPRPSPNRQPAPLPPLLTVTLALDARVHPSLRGEPRVK